MCVPGRPWPTITIGGVTGPPAISGWTRRSSTTPSRLVRYATTSPLTIASPSSLSRPSRFNESRRTSSASRHSSPPKSESRDVSTAWSTSGSACSSATEIAHLHDLGLGLLDLALGHEEAPEHHAERSASRVDPVRHARVLVRDDDAVRAVGFERGVVPVATAGSVHVLVGLQVPVPHRHVGEDALGPVPGHHQG